MGTSISQPSPRGGKTGKDWKEAKLEVELSVTASGAINALTKAIKAEHGLNAGAVLVDAGVKLVEKVLENSSNTNKSKTEVASGFLMEARKALAMEGANSFFAEIAVSSASKCISKGTEELKQRFSAQFVTDVINYYISRDLPDTFGSRGLLSAEEIRNRLSDIHKNLDSVRISKKAEDTEALVISILSSEGK